MSEWACTDKKNLDRVARMDGSDTVVGGISLRVKMNLASSEFLLGEVKPSPTGEGAGSLRRSSWRECFLSLEIHR